ncbi:MAG: hypothetical protein DSY37_03865 [Hyperthermus sp.]|nr:MAG: hypothetical protein DSY37_03865 [Hyperthermus sp.]
MAGASSRPERLADALEMLGRGLVIAFMIVLLLAAVALAIGNEVFANQLAERAYYMLVAGVVSLLASTSLAGGGGENGGSEGATRGEG